MFGHVHCILFEGTDAVSRSLNFMWCLAVQWLSSCLKHSQSVRHTDRVGALYLQAAPLPACSCLMSNRGRIKWMTEYLRYWRICRDSYILDPEEMCFCVYISEACSSHSLKIAKQYFPDVQFWISTHRPRYLSTVFFIVAVVVAFQIHIKRPCRYLMRSSADNATKWRTFLLKHWLKQISELFFHHQRT